VGCWKFSVKVVRHKDREFACGKLWKSASCGLSILGVWLHEAASD